MKTIELEHNQANSQGNPSIVIIGAGFAGITLALRLKRAGFDSVLIVEKGDGVGGVWRENTYPGAACDVPSQLYSISSAPNPTWGRRYAEQPDILAYLRRVVDESGLPPLLRTQTEISKATFDERSNTWRLTTTTNQELECDVVISAVGQLSRPSVPNIAGISRFAGPSFHSADWDHDLNLSGKRVAVVGTGASAVQFVPVVAECAEHLDVFQRSAPWVLPKIDRQYGERHHQLLRRLPILRLGERLMIWTIFEFLALALVDAKPVARALGAVALGHLGRQVRDANLRSQLTPDYAPGCKRILFSSDYYPALGRPNVSLVTEDIEAVEAGGIRTVDGGFHAADVVIYGTGFTATEFLSPMEVHGRADRKLSEVWADGAHAYYGLSVPDFPNFFMMYGPNTNVGSGSIVYMLESQARHIVRLMKVLRAHPGTAVEVRATAEWRFNQLLSRRLDKSVWTLCSSWYRSARGSISTNWPSPTFLYRVRTRRPRRNAYVLSNAVATNSSSGRTPEPAHTGSTVSSGTDSAD
ncbi:MULTISPECIES: flavin-containing monooxygenase [Mycolicibacterium]|jgi:cation diffusion facilitator CzcD-associated flavoprotein CzcO|uniref:Putative monooxygenase n=1 Tax=Mycolicibacterium sediminis TaxID=1286180 RepID=A0A7I7QJ71_9MYCO|nr:MULTISPECIES: NAD(P)/FAD-dependent oxidoreductase [Mycolicibacterium]BBY26315.1 putative monooxygenase [Mycolicibacterium sediminis]